MCILAAAHPLAADGIVGEGKPLGNAGLQIMTTYCDGVDRTLHISARLEYPGTPAVPMERGAGC